MNILLKTAKSYVIEKEGRIEIQRRGWLYILVGIGVAIASFPLMGLFFLELDILEKVPPIFLFVWYLLPLSGVLFLILALIMIGKGIYISLERKYIFDGLQRVLLHGRKKIPFSEISNIRFQRFSSSKFNFNLAELTDFEGSIPITVASMTNYSISAGIGGRKIYLIEATNPRHYESLRKTAFALHKLWTGSARLNPEQTPIDDKQDQIDSRIGQVDIFSIIFLVLGLVMCVGGLLFSFKIFTSSKWYVEFIFWVMGPWLIFSSILQAKGIPVDDWKNTPAWVKGLFVAYFFVLLILFQHIL